MNNDHAAPVSAAEALRAHLAETMARFNERIKAQQKLDAEQIGREAA